MRRLAREGGDVDLVPSAGTQEAIAALEHLHGLRWAEKGETGVLSGSLTGQLLRRVAPALSAAELLRLHHIRLSGQTIAVLFALRGKNRTCYFLSGFDPDYAHLSPGTLLIGAAINQASQDGATRFDFLRGEEDYKYRWGARNQRRQHRVLVPAG